MRSRSGTWLLAALSLTACSLGSGCTGQIEPGSPGTMGGAGTGTPGGGTGTPGAGTPGAGTGTPGTGTPGTGTPGTGTGTPGTGVGGQPVAKPLTLHGNPKYFRFVRLTNEQWANSIRDLLRLPAVPATSSLPSPVANATDFNNNELLLDVSSRMWGEYQTAAEAVVKTATATDAALRQIYTGTQDAATFIQTFGRRVYRRPLTAAEVTTYQAVFTTGSGLSGSQSAFTKGAGLVIEAMLQSPHFLYRSEMAANGAPLTAFEMAAKLSLFLRETTPSDALLDAAAGTGRYDTPEGAASLASTMLDEPNAKAVMRKFHAGLLDIDNFANISKVGAPAFTDAFNDELIESSLLFFDRIFTKQLGLRDMLTSTTGFVGAGLAPMYGVQAPASGFVERDLGPKRAGFLLQIPFLAQNAINSEASPIHRGVHVNHDILCADPGAAVPDLPTPPPVMPNQTNRERFEALTSVCGGECHNWYINPAGFAFENYDGLGQWRDMQNGKPINPSGQYPFAEGVKPFQNAAEFLSQIAEGEQAHLCYSKKLASFALQRDVIASDMPLLMTMKNASMASTGNIKQLILELVKSPSFRTRVGGAQ